MNSQGNPSADAHALHQAMRGPGTRERELIRVLSGAPNVPYVQQVRQEYEAMTRHDLVRDIESETSGYFGEACIAIVRGPKTQDSHVLYEAMRGMGTNETVLNEILLGRSNVEIHGISQEYERLYRKPLKAAVLDELSFKTRDLFEHVLRGTRAEENTPVYPEEVRRCTTRLSRATSSDEQTAFIEVLAHCSDGQIRAISQDFRQQNHGSLQDAVSRRFSGHMKHAFLRMLAVAEDRAKADADSLEDAMRGVGTEDRNLLNRLVRIHWNKEHLYQVKGAYKHFKHKDLGKRVKGETSGDFRELLLALIGPEQR